MKNTERDEIEKVLLDNFSGVIKPLREDDVSTLDKYKDGSFGFSYLGIMLYANGCNKKGRSTLHPQGLIYYDGEVIFGIGFFKKNTQEPVGHLNIIAPRGNNWLVTIDNFIKRLRAFSHFPKTSIYIRHLHESQYKDLIGVGYKPISVDPWDSLAPSEDETFNHRFIKIDDIIDYNDNEHIVVKTLATNNSRNFRKKAKMAYNRFENFLDRNGLEYHVETYDFNVHKDLARNMVIDHFKTLKNAIGSTPDDYFNLINYIPTEMENEFVGYVGFLVSENEKIPISLFMGERIGKNTVALYATFALRNKRNFREKFDIVGYSAISQYVYINVFDLLKKKGYKYIDLGGSEIENLDIFKRQLGASEKKTYWVIKT